MTTKAQRINHIAKLIKKATTVTGNRACIKSLADQVQATIDVETLEQYSELVTRVNPTETYTELTERVTPTETYTEIKARVLEGADATSGQLSSVSSYATQLETESDLETAGTLATNIKTAADAVEVEKTGVFNFNERYALFDLTINTATLINPLITFWGNNYAYQSLQTTTENTGTNVYDFTHTVESQGISIEGSTSIEGNTYIYDYVMTASQELSDITGAVFEFNFKTAAEPDAYLELIPDNHGFIIKGLTTGDIRFEFENPILNVTGTSGTPSLVRVVFIGSSLNIGEYPNRLSITLPEEIEITGTVAERLGTPTQWNTGLIVYNQSPVDLSFMNDSEAPAGKRGRLERVGDKFVFEDETEMQFWGCNLQAYALFHSQNTDAVIIEQAERISKLGYNLVRIHHHDSWGSPNIFGTLPNTSTLELYETALLRLDKLLYELKIRGIYVWLDMHSKREFIAATDGIESTEIFKGAERSYLFGYMYLDEDTRNLMLDFQAAYLNRTSTITDIKYKDDPAIVAALIINECELTHHFGNNYLGDKGVPIISAEFMAIADAFATEHSLTASQVKATWAAGPSKLLLNQLEHEYNEIMIAGLTTAGYTGLKATTNTWGNNPMFSLPALTDGDIIDVHSYGGAGFLGTNPRFNPNYTTWIAMAQVNGYPLSITEWNIETSYGVMSHDRFVGSIYTAAMSAFQGWGMPMLYGYCQQVMSGQGNPDTYSAFNDPAQMAFQPAAALLYRQGHVAPAEETYAISLDQDTFYNNAITPLTSITVRTLPEMHRMVIDIPETTELPWISPPTVAEGVTLVTDLDTDFIPEGNEVVSDTGELIRNWKNEDYKIITEKTSGVFGWIGGRTITLPSLVVIMNNPYCGVTFQAVDNVSTDTSDMMLITVCARSVPVGNVYQSESLDGTIKVKAKSGLTLYKLSNSGAETEYSSTYEDGLYTFTVDENVDTFWFKLHAAV